MAPRGTHGDAADSGASRGVKTSNSGGPKSAHGERSGQAVASKRPSQNDDSAAANAAAKEPAAAPANPAPAPATGGGWGAKTGPSFAEMLKQAQAAPAAHPVKEEPKAGNMEADKSSAAKVPEAKAAGAPGASKEATSWVSKGAAASKDAASKEAASKDGVSKDGASWVSKGAAAAKDAAPKDEAPKDEAPKNLAPKDEAPKDAASKDGASWVYKGAVSKDAASKDGASKDAASKDGASKDAASKDGASAAPVAQEQTPQSSSVNKAAHAPNQQQHNGPSGAHGGGRGGRGSGGGGRGGGGRGGGSYAQQSAGAGYPGQQGYPVYPGNYQGNYVAPGYPNPPAPAGGAPPATAASAVAAVPKATPPPRKALVIKDPGTGKQLDMSPSAAAFTPKTTSTVTTPASKSTMNAAAEDWESRGDSVANTPQAPAPPAKADDGRLIYTFDFMRTLASANMTRPTFNADTDPSIIMDKPRPFEIAAYDVSSMARAPHGGGGGGGRGSGQGGGPPGGGGGEGEEWGSRRGPGRGGYEQGGRDMRGGPNPQRARSSQVEDSGPNWGGGNKRGVPSSGGVGSRNSGVQLHHSANRWQGDKATTDDPEEEKRQKALKGLLNKLTLDTFDKLTKLLLEVDYTHSKTLEGLIDQIFDKALVEGHFCEMYSNLCRTIHPLLPSFPSAQAGGRPIDFRRLLLNKCQVEFENGTAAMRAESEEVDDETLEKEEEEADKLAESIEKAEADGLEEGEISIREEKLKKMDQKIIAANEIKARRRMLGNIGFIGHLYKSRLLTEKIMHNCVVTLLTDETSPRAEDIECLCKLMTTVGGLLDSSAKPENKNAMEVYFTRMARLKEGKVLDVRTRFLVQDVLDLRARKWIPRTKAEGPKKIEDVHKEAAQQLQQQAQRDREERERDRRGGGGGGRGRRDDRGGGDRDNSRHMSRDELPRAMQSNSQRPASSEVNLRPPTFGRGGKGGGGGSGGPPPSTSSGTAGAYTAPSQRAEASQGGSAAPAAAAAAPSMDLAATKIGAHAIVEEFLVNGIMGEAMESFRSLRAKNADMGNVVHLMVLAALDVRGKELADRIKPFKAVFEAALEAGPATLSKAEFQQGTCNMFSSMHSLAEDLPKAPILIANFVSDFLAEGVVDLALMCKAFLDYEKVEEGGDPPLVDSEHALGVLYAMIGRCA
eukprot:gene1220-32561_t